MSFLAGVVTGTTGQSAPLVPTVFSLKTSSTNNQTSTSGLTAVDSSTGTGTIPVTLVNPTLAGISSFTPFTNPQGYWSWQANGALNEGSTLVPNNAAMVTTTTSDFTWEAYITRNGLSSTNMCLASAATAGLYILRVNGDTGAHLLSTSQNYTGSAFATALKHGQWAHFAAVRASGILTFYLNGKPILSAANSTAYTFTGGTSPSHACIGGANNATGQDWVGNISNLRITIGTAVYTGPFVPSATPLTTLANTKLLTFNGPSYIDYSGQGTTFTMSFPSGGFSGRIMLANPFSATQSFVPGTDQGSFVSLSTNQTVANGTMGYVRTTSSPAAIGSADFTIDGWIYLTTSNAAASYLSVWVNPTIGSSAWAISQGNAATNANTQFRYVAFPGTNQDVNTSAAGVSIPGGWMHFVCVRTGGAFSTFVNGVRVTGPSTSAVGTGSYPNALPLCLFNYQNAGSNLVNGYGFNIRYMIGTAAYSPSATTYTVPTSTTGLTNTTVAMNFRNPGMYDGTGNVGVTTVGTARVSTTSPAYGTASISLPASGDHLLLANSRAEFQFGPGDFTVEGWINWTNADSTLFYIIDSRNPTQTTGWNMARSAANKLVWSYGSGTGGAIATSTSNLDVMGVWTHVAYSRTGGVGRLFINGVLDTTVTDTQSYDVSPIFSYIGAGTGAVSSLVGNVQGFRVSKFGRYIANFTPPTDV